MCNLHSPTGSVCADSSIPKYGLLAMTRRLKLTRHKGLDVEIHIIQDSEEMSRVFMHKVSTKHAVQHHVDHRLAYARDHLGQQLHFHEVGDQLHLS